MRHEVCLWFSNGLTEELVERVEGSLLEVVATRARMCDELDGEATYCGAVDGVPQWESEDGSWQVTANPVEEEPRERKPRFQVRLWHWDGVGFETVEELETDDVWVAARFLARVEADASAVGKLLSVWPERIVYEAGDEAFAVAHNLPSAVVPSRPRQPQRAAA